MEGLESPTEEFKIFLSTGPTELFKQVNHEMEPVLWEDYCSSGAPKRLLMGETRLLFFPCCLGDSFLLSLSQPTRLCSVDTLRSPDLRAIAVSPS